MTGPSMASIRVLLIAAVICITTVLIPAEPCRGWGASTHLRIAREALGAMPPAMQAELAGDSTDLNEGILYPDFTLRDLENHSWCPEGACGSALEKIEAEYQGIIGDFQGRSLARALALVLLVFPAGCSSGSDGSLGPTAEQAGSIAFRLGLVAHYLSDINQPYHTVESVGAYDAGHDEFEHHADDIAGTLPFRFDGVYTDVGGNVRGFAMASAQASFTDLQLLSGPAGERDGALYRQVMERRFSQAVNDVIDLWYSILIRIR